jgi:serine protease inhibitor
MNNQFNLRDNKYVYLDDWESQSTDLPDTTVVASNKQSSRTWGIPSESVKNILDMPQSSDSYTDSYSSMFNPAIPAPSITKHNNLMSGYGNQFGYGDYEEYDDGHSGHNNKKSSISVLPERKSIFSVMSNLYYGKMHPHFENKFNQIYSPYSLYYIALCALVGSTGNTFKQLGDAMGINKSDIVPSMIEDCMNLYHHISKQEGVQISVMNGFFVRDSFQNQIMESYKNFAKKIGQIKPLNFNNKSGTVSTINSWVKDGTRGLIPNFINESGIDNNTVMMVINIIYFKSMWMCPFDKSSTQTKPFRKSNGLSVNVPMMYQSEDFKYVEDSKYQMVTMAYTNPNFVMHVILPQPSNNNEFPVQNLHNFLETYRPHQREKTVKVYLPKFTQKTKQKLNDCFKNLGVIDLFSMNRAELFNIAKPVDGVNRLYVSEIIQEAVIIVDESGTEATAATLMSMMRNCSSMSKDIVFNANRTFQYIIEYVPSNTILFTGVYDA